VKKVSFLTTATIDSVHDTGTGRIDAERVAELLDIRLSELAVVLQQSYETLRKSPSRVDAQSKLTRLVHSWNQIHSVLGTDEHVSRWLHHPLPESGMRPLDILLGGDGLEEFTDLVGRIVTGTYR
jgi:uncharacterized protein (DUF2384 family)